MRWMSFYVGCAVGLGIANAQAPVIAEFSTDKSAPESSLLAGITAGPDGNLWFTEYFPHPRIGKITPTGIVTKYGRGFTALLRPEYGLSVEVTLGGITAGPDGNLWFTEGRANRIGRITPSGLVTEYSKGVTLNPYMAGGDAGLTSITAGPDGNLWFTETYGGRVGKITTAGVIVEYSMNADIHPYAITAGPDGNLWFTELGANRIGKITPAGVVTEYSKGITPDPSPVNGLVGLHGITAGSDGNLWFAEYDADRIGKITTAGVITEYTKNVSGPYGISAGPDGNLWFTDHYGGRVGRITTAGVVLGYSEGIRLQGARPADIAVGPDRSIWFIEGGSRIGRITLVSAQITSNSEAPPPRSQQAFSGPKEQRQPDQSIDWAAFEDGSADFIHCWDGSMENGVNCSERLGETSRDRQHAYGRPDYVDLGRRFEYWFTLALRDADLARKRDIRGIAVLRPHISKAFEQFHSLAEKLSVTPQNICQLADWHHGFQGPGYDRQRFCSDVYSCYRTSLRRSGPLN